MTCLASVELLLQLVRREPEVCIPTGLVVGDHAVVDEASNAGGAFCVTFLPAGELQLDDLIAAGEPVPKGRDCWVAGVSCPGVQSFSLR